MSFSPGTSAIAAFCRDLREARRYRQVSLGDVAEATRITREYLEALEAGRWDEIPPAYLRGYLALYAQAVGMNCEKVLRSFDQMTAPGTAQEKAVLDEGPRLLTEPQLAEVTRAKIRTTWFAALSRNRTAMFAVTLAALLVLLGLLHWSRRAHELRVPTVPFSAAVHENSSKVHGPLTLIPLAAKGMDEQSASASGRWVTCVGLAPGVLAAGRDSLAVERRRFGAYDTIEVEFIRDITVTIHPSHSALCFYGGSLMTLEGLSARDTAVYEVKAAGVAE